MSAGSYAHKMKLINRKRNPHFCYNLCPREILLFFPSETDNWENLYFIVKKEGG